MIIYNTDIVKTWVEQAKIVDDDNPMADFIKFAFLWFAFNQIYSNYMPTDRYMSERNAVIKSAEAFSYKEIDEIVFQSDGFRFFCDLEKDNNRVKPMGKEMGNTQLKSGYNEDYEDAYISSDNVVHKFRGLLSILYTVRCNLFHGSKGNTNERDREIVKNAVDCLEWMFEISKEQLRRKESQG